MSKVVIVGAGLVGSTIAYALMLGGTAKEIVLLDRIEEKARTEAMDLNHCASFVRPVRIKSGGYEECSNADIVIVTAGAPQKPGQTRLELVDINTRIIKQIVESTMAYTKEIILLIVTNPVDVMSYIAWKISGLPSSKVFGSGTVLDTSRFRHILSSRCQLDPRNMHAYVVGEHGDSEVPLWSTANVAGVSMDIFCADCHDLCSQEGRDEISYQVRRSAYEIIEGKGATYFAISLAVQRIVESILRDEHSVLTVSTLLENVYGIDKLYLSFPCVLGRNGVERVLPLEMSPDEEEQFLRSAQVVEESIPSQIKMAGNNVPAM
ncbi:MAG TPA: L-lactate dehydrogenase [Firmicutes bacterium]|jgi:L-lactate dehydrogenase|nr:L-lactate dehydrogenase [Bacillota bacterium]